MTPVIQFLTTVFYPCFQRDAWHEVTLLRRFISLDEYAASRNFS